MRTDLAVSGARFVASRAAMLLLGGRRPLPCIPTDHARIAAAAMFSFLTAAAPSFAGCGFPWTVGAFPKSDHSIAIEVCGSDALCLPHDPQIKVVGNEITLTYTKAELPDCLCLTDTREFNDMVVTDPVAPGHYSVTVQTLDCGKLTTVGTTEVFVPGSSSSQLELTSFPNPSLPNSSFILTAAVSGAGVVPTGSVTFVSNLCTQPCGRPSFPIGTAVLDGAGKATLLFPGLPEAGSCTFFANFGGDVNYGPTYGILTQVVSSGGATIPTLDRKSLFLLSVLLAVAAVLLLRGQAG